MRPKNLLDRARKHELAISSMYIDVIFETVDALDRLVGQVRRFVDHGEALAHDEALAPLMETIRAMAAGRLADQAPAGEPAGAVEPARKLGEILIETGAGVALWTSTGPCSRRPRAPHTRAWARC